MEVMGKITEEQIYEREYVMLYVVSGQITATVDLQVYLLGEGELLLTNPLSHIRLSMEDTAVYSKLIFSGAALNKYYPGRELTFRCTPDQGADEAYALVKGLVEKIFSFSITRQDKSRPLSGTALFFEFLDLLISEFLEEEAQADSRYAEKKNVLQYMEEHYGEHLTLRMVAEQTYLSYHYLSHRFQSIFGKKFYDLLDEIRMRHVLGDLLYTDKTITRIAMDNGYSSSSVLNRNFKSCYGVGPGEYRKTARAAAAGNSAESAGGSQPADSLSDGAGSAAGYRLPAKNSDETGQILMQRNHPFDLHGDGQGKNESSDPAPAVLRIIPFQTDETDRTSEGENFYNIFGTMINGGHAIDLLDSSVREQIRLLCRDLGFTYVRFYGPFCREMDIQRGQDFSRVSFRKLDVILDFLIECGIRPWIDFGNKPHNIYKDMSNISEQVRKEDRGYMRSQQDVNRLIRLLDLFMRHVVHRYGRQETARWRYEFWNDRYQMKEELFAKDDELYLQLFDAASDTIKKYVPEAKVGGNGIPLNYRSYDIIKIWGGHRRPEFVTSIFFPYDDPEKDYSSETEKIAYTTNLFSFAPELRKLKKCMESSGIEGQLVVDEYGSTVSNRDFQNDSCYQSAYLVRNAIAGYGLADVAGFWCASDLPFLAYDTDGPLFGGSGLLTADGIRKPAYYAIDFLNRVKGQILCRNEFGVLTGEPDGSYTFLGHNFQQKNLDYYVSPSGFKEIRRHINAEGESLLFSICLHVREDASYSVKIWREGMKNGNLLGEWYRLQCPSDIDRMVSGYLKYSAAPRLDRYIISSVEGKLELNLEISCQEILLVQISHNELEKH